MEFSIHEYCSELPSPAPGNQTRVSCIAGRFFLLSEPQGKPMVNRKELQRTMGKERILRTEWCLDKEVINEKRIISV